MNSRVSLLAAALLTGAASTALPAQPHETPTSSLPAAVRLHIDMAYFILKGDVSVRLLPAILNVIDAKAFPDPMQQVRALARLPATKAFDQLYFLGTPEVSAWALETSDGIILIDTLNNADEAKSYIEEGMKRVGLDPARIRYILVTHGHADHYGGAKYLAEKYRARVLMSPADWALAARSASSPAREGRPAPVPAPTHDIDVTDGQALTLGTTTLKLYITPGHTPGTVSATFPVTDRGRPHTVSFLGGMGMAPVDKDPAQGGFSRLRDSLTRLGKVSFNAGADVLVSCHPFMDDSWEKAKAVLDNTAGTVSPWVVGADAVWRYYAAAIATVDAVETYYTLNPPKRAPGP